MEEPRDVMMLDGVDVKGCRLPRVEDLCALL